MTNQHSITVSLEEFGLSKYEAKAYVALISKGTISASELAFYAEIPRTKVYPVLLKLEKKKLAIISKSKPITCTAIAPEDAFDEAIHEQINKVNAMNSLVSNLKEASEESKKSRGAEEKRYFQLNANNVLEQLKTMIESSKSSVHIMVDQWGLNLLAECKEQIIQILRRNLDVKVILPSSQVGSEAFRKIPNAKMRMSDVVQNCFIFDNLELLILDNTNGKGAIFSSANILASNMTNSFNNIWKNSLKADCLADLTKNEAQEIFRIINIVNENGLGHVLSLGYSAKNSVDMIKLLEKNGINLKTKSLHEIVELVDFMMQIMCSGHAIYDKNSDNITVESKVNSGHSLPWVSVLESYLAKQGYKTRIVLQNNSQRGEKIHIKINSN